MLRRLLFAAIALLTLPAPAQTNPDWTTPIAPFRIADNLFYVGSRDLAAYLIVTPKGHILINANLASSVPQIRDSMKQLGLRFADIRILLISQAHWDHEAGAAALIQQTGAKYMVMDSDVPVVETGGSADFAYGEKENYLPAKVSRTLHDGDQVKLGGVVLTAHKTPGHTRGCTTWTMITQQKGHDRNVVIVGGWSPNDSYRLLDKPGKPASYPGIATDFEHTFDVLRSLPCDIFLGAHGGYFNMLPKLSRSRTEGPTAWIDPEGYKHAINEKQKSFEAELARQKAAQ